MKSPVSLDRLRNELAKFNERWKHRGGALCTWYCGHCGHRNPQPRPTRRDVGPRDCWSSMKACVGCGELSFVLTWAGGKTEARSWV